MPQYQITIKKIGPPLVLRNSEGWYKGPKTGQETRFVPEFVPLLECASEKEAIAFGENTLFKGEKGWVKNMETNEEWDFDGKRSE